MPRALLAVVLAALFFIAAPSTPDAKTPKLLESVRPLAVLVVVKEHNLETGEVKLRGTSTNICTVSSINTKLRYWLTAAHCVANTERKYYIMGEQVKVIMHDVPNDLAILQTATVTLPALKLAKNEPEVGDRVEVAGHPFGWVFPVFTTGIVSAVKGQPWPESEDGWNAYWMFISAPGAPGNSGSSVVNSKGEVISVVQMGFMRSFSPVMGGVPWDVLVKYRGYWKT